MAALSSCSGAEGFSEIEAFLEELRNSAQDKSADAPAPSTCTSSSLAEFEAQQVQQLVERAALSEDGSVSPARTGDLDDRLCEQWHTDRDTSNVEERSSQMFVATDPGSKSPDDGFTSESAQAGKDCAINHAERGSLPLGNGDFTSEGVCVS